MPDRVQEQLKSLPAKPGVYLFRDEAGEVLYIGKAKTLRSRVRSYFQKTTDGRAQIGQLVGRVTDLEVIVTGSEVEALHLEQNLVKRHRPPFNVRLRDDKSFPYIAVTVEDEYPRVMFTRERHRPGVWYFGPYANAKKVRETLDVLNRVFPYRPCEGPKPGRHSGIPCLDYHIDRCLAPCVGYVSRENYRAIIDGVIEFLSGNTRPIQRELEQKMQDAAAEERFEDAARYRNRLYAVQHLVERQAVERHSGGTADVVGFAAEGDRAVVQIFPLRGGKMIDRHSFHLENVGGQDVTTVLESFGLEYYGNTPSVPPQIVVPRDAGDLSALAKNFGFVDLPLCLRRQIGAGSHRERGGQHAGQSGDQHVVLLIGGFLAGVAGYRRDDTENGAQPVIHTVNGVADPAPGGDVPFFAAQDGIKPAFGAGSLGVSGERPQRSSVLLFVARHVEHQFACWLFF